MGNYATGTAPCGGGDGSLRAGSAPQLELLHRGRELAAADRAFARGGQILHGPVRSPRRLDRAVHRSQGAHFAMVTAGK